MKLTSIIGPLPGRREAHALAWLALTAGVILCGVSVKLGFEGLTLLGRPMGGDFVEFYTIGKILNNYAPARIYDLKFAVDLQHATLPGMPDTQMLVFGQAPFIGWLFRPFALLPYAWAYVAWLVFSAALYIAALSLLFRTAGLGAEDRKTGFLLALSMTPFLFETWIGGQVSVVAFMIWALFFWCLKNNRPALAGFVLAVCLFKPTLVALPAAMLIVGRRWRVVGGFAAGAVAMAGLSVATVGLEGCRRWIEVISFNGRVAGGAGEAAHQAKCVDLLAFSHLLLAHWPRLADGVALTLALVAVGWLSLQWWKSPAAAMDYGLWAATLCILLVASPYMPIYDTILVVFGVVLLAYRGQFSAWLLALYMVPWLTQAFAEFLHLQVLTVVIGGFGVWAAKPVLSRIIPGEEESTMSLSVGRRATGRFQVRSRGLL